MAPQASVYNLFGQYLVQNAVEGDHPRTWIRGEKTPMVMLVSPLKHRVGVVPGPLPNGRTFSLHGLQMGVIR